MYSNRFLKFRVRMETERWRHVSIARAVVFDFFKYSKVVASVRFDRFGNSEFSSTEEKKILVSGKQTDEFSFSFSKSDNRLSLKTSFGVALHMKG